MKKFLLVPVILLNYFIIFITGCSVNTAKIDNSLKKYFDSAKVDGCFSMVNNSTGSVMVYNMKLDTQRVVPASSFMIVNSLIGLETGKVIDESMVIKWDGVQRPDSGWNQDLSLEKAFKLSAIPYQQELARRIGRDTMQQWLDTLKYGNMDISGPIDSFWLNNSLEISPDEQLGLVKKLYFDMLPFQKRSQQIVRDLMLRENNTLYKFSYITGRGWDMNNTIAWMLGWIEENRHVYFFVTMVKSDDNKIDVDLCMNITKRILTQRGFFKGEM